ncbi:MAG: pyridoxal phosphate-dependent aminotransferase [Bacteriovoracia bacterium]
MANRLAERLQGVTESSTLKMNALARELVAKGTKVYNLTAGEPNFDVPPVIREAAKEAVDKNFSKYTPVAGIADLKKAIQQKLKKENSLEYAVDQILVSVGAKHSIFNALMALINPGDEVLIPAPYWVSYPEMVKLFGGVPIILETTQESGYKISAKDIKGAITPKTKLLILNSPSNPTGVTYCRSELESFAGALEDSKVLVLSDEVYEKIIFDKKVVKEGYTSFASLSQDAYDRTITVNSFSKTYAMTGWRLGYAAGPKDILNAMALIQGQSTSGATSIVQKAAIDAFKVSESTLKEWCSVYERRLKKYEEIFSGEKNLSYIRPQGAFYFFLNIGSAIGKSYNHDNVLAGSEEVAFYLLDAYHVATVAGRGFGADEYLRLSFAVSDEELELGAKKIIEGLKALR